MSNDTHSVNIVMDGRPAKELLDLSIIIINWNSKEFLRKCLASIRDSIKNVEYEVIIIDNASYDGAEEMVRSTFPETMFIQSDKNLGFAGANNLGFAYSSGRNILFLNPDTEIKGTAIQSLLTALESDQNIGMVGARLLNSDLSVQTTSITALPSVLNQVIASNYLKTRFPKLKAWGMRPLYESTNRTARVDAISGACMLARRKVLEKIGCFTTEYFMYAEDMDLCIKVSKTGAQIHYVPDAVIVHHGGSSSAKRKESNFSSIVQRESLMQFFKLHRGHAYALLYRAATGAIAFCRIAVLILCSPLSVTSAGRRFLSRAASKWMAILLWSLGMHSYRSVN
ncbi:MAG TPA: glycosyltransferase family 2 protein [Alloacidobacterium sp.]|nr:glycosyltransferase family 2 protein [Alloacidobacterium sp.]